ncbi:MAG: hypothetical protein NVS9B10_15000 [Nevskia sp.]
MNTAARVVPAGAKCLPPKKAGAKFDRSVSWVWKRLKEDPEFPRPFYLGKNAPVFIESELDQYLAAMTEKFAPQSHAA